MLEDMSLQLERFRSAADDKSRRATAPGSLGTARGPTSARAAVAAGLKLPSQADPRRQTPPRMSATVDASARDRFTSISAEEHVLGAMLIGASFDAVARLAPDDFSDPRHSLIFRAIAALGRDGHQVDVDAVTAQLEALQHLQAAGGREILAQLRDNTATAANAALYARRVLELGVQRRLADALQRTVSGAGLLEILEREQQNLKSATTNRGAQAFPVQRLDEATFEPRESLVQNLGLDAGTVAAIVGAPNGGKTAFAVSLGLAVASELDHWLGLRVARAPVLYVAPEAPASVKMRARAASQRLELDRPAFYVSDGVPALGGETASTFDADRVVETVEAVMLRESTRVGLVFLDTLASCLGDGDENSDGMVRLVAASKYIAARTNACVVLLHHPSKNDGAGLRGHGSLAAACDSIIRIEIEELTGVRIATLVKARDHATGLQIRFEVEPVALAERDSFGEPLTTILVRPSNQAAPRPQPSGRRQRELLAELERRYRTGERQWDEATIAKAGRDLGMHRNSPRDALRGLVKAGYLIGSSMSLSLKHSPEDPK